MAILFIHKGLCRRVTALHCTLRGYSPSPRLFWAVSATEIPVAADASVSADPPFLDISAPMLVRCPGKFGREANDRGDDEVLGTYVQHPRDANRRLPRRSPRPRAVRGRGRLRGGQSLPLVARSPADERERSRAGTAPTAPRVGGQAPASASRPTQPEGGRWSGRGCQRCRVPGAARARMPHGNHPPHSAGSAAGLRVAPGTTVCIRSMPH